MKPFNLKHIIGAALAIVLFSSCSDFLDKTPLTEPNNETYLSSENQVYSYINGLYMALPSYPQWGMGPRGEDKNSDNILSLDYDPRLNGEYTQFSGDTDWSTGYENLRDVNYFFAYYIVAEENETENLRSLRGEAHFFRAYWHFYLLKKFGAVPVMDGFWDGNATLEGLQIPQKSRNEVARYILSDLDAAIGLLHSRSKFNGLRINKEAALTLAMNVALYEGTWEKYHADDAFASAQNESEYFLGKVIEYGDDLFELMPVSSGLNTQQNDPFGAPNPEDPYAHLFNQKDYTSVNEALLWKKYSLADGVQHFYVNCIAGGISDPNDAAGVSKSLVDNYLYADGTFINPADEKFKQFDQMFADRDLRLKETVMGPGHKFRSATLTKPLKVGDFIEGADEGTNPGDEPTEDQKFNSSLNPPYLTNTGNARSLTGFHIAMGVDTTMLNESNWDTGYILIRYAEALLAYAEASEELNKCTDDVIAKTIRPLRERAGVTWVTPTADPNFKDFKKGTTITPMLQEIRRERRSELALQSYRLDDILRWAAAENIIKGQRGLGAYFGDDGILYKSFNHDDEDTQEALKLVLTNEDHWIDPLKERLPNGYQFNLERDYLLPKPPDDVIMLHGNLAQNPGW